VGGTRNVGGEQRAPDLPRARGVRLAARLAAGTHRPPAEGVVQQVGGGPREASLGGGGRKPRWPPMASRTSTGGRRTGPPSTVDRRTAREHTTRRRTAQRGTGGRRMARSSPAAGPRTGPFGGRGVGAGGGGDGARAMPPGRLVTATNNHLEREGFKGVSAQQVSEAAYWKDRGGPKLCVSFAWKGHCRWQREGGSTAASCTQRRTRSRPSCWEARWCAAGSRKV
jgi:hypothetical protein